MTWHPVIQEDDLWEGELRGVTAGTVKIMLVNAGGRIRAFRDECPHKGTPLSDADFDGSTIVCPTHNWEFDACTGCGINPGDSQLIVHEVRVEGGTVVVCDEPSPAAA